MVVRLVLKGMKGKFLVWDFNAVPCLAAENSARLGLLTPLLPTQCCEHDAHFSFLVATLDDDPVSTQTNYLISALRGQQGIYTQPTLACTE